MLMTQTSATQERSEQAGYQHTICPFHVSLPEEALVDPRRRIATTRWPENETLAGQSQIGQLAKLQKLVYYWGTQYDRYKGGPITSMVTWHQQLQMKEIQDVLAYVLTLRKEHRNGRNNQNIRFCR